MRISDWSSDVCSSDLKYEIIVEQLAQAHKVSGTALADISTDLGLTETLTIGLDGGTTATVDVTADMSASDVVYAINAVSSTTGARASAVKVRSEEHTSELQSLMRKSYAVFSLKKKTRTHATKHHKQ